MCLPLGACEGAPGTQAECAEGDVCCTILGNAGEINCNEIDVSIITFYKAIESSF